jgi:protein O-mannosyl-transferase
VKKLLPYLLIALTTLAVYAPATRNGFVWDDTAVILRDPLIRSWRLIPEGFNHFLFTDATASDFYRPLQRLTYTVDYAAAGFAPAMYHVVSVLWHIAAASALFLCACELLRAFGIEERKRWWVALAASLAWAVHPLHNSAVAYISGRADPLAAAFGFAGIYLGLRSRRAAGRAQWAWAAATGAALLLSALSKEAGFVYACALLLILALLKDWRTLRPIGTALLFVAVTYLTLRLPAEHTPPPPPSDPAPAIVRPLLVGRAFAEYTGLFVLPLQLHMERDVETQPSGTSDEGLAAVSRRELQTLLGAALLAAFLYWMAKARRDPAVFVCLALSLLAYLPASGVYRLNATIAEHWLYAPSAFLLVAVALTGLRILEERRLRARWLAPVLRAAFALWLVFLGGRTFARTFDWKDQRTFLERTIAAGGGSTRMFINLGALEMTEGNYDKARAHLDRALAKQPEQPFAIINRASLAVKENDFARARELLMPATKMPLIEAQAHELLTVVQHKESGETNLIRMRLASRSGPPNWLIARRYIRLLSETGATDAAIAELRRCLTTQWYRAETWQLLGDVLAKNGRIDEAAQARRRAELYDVRLHEHASRG